jgi:omega-amidase
MRVATASINQVWEDKKKNIVLCKEFVQASVRDSVDVVIFPELTLTGFSSKSSNLLVEDIGDSKTLSLFGEMSKKNSINIIFGAYVKLSKDSKPSNVLCLSDRFGKTKILYSKIHLFSYGNEDKYLDSGNVIVKKQIEEVVFGFSICYDLRFPELFSIMSNDCQVVVVIANWPSARSKHWEALLTARAIENECILIGVNRTGVDGNGIYYDRNSMVILPNGKRLKPNLSNLELDIYDIDVNIVQNYRNIFPTLNDKKFKLYSQEYKKNSRVKYEI